MQRLQLASAIAVLALSGCASGEAPAPANAAVTGTVIYRERILLAPPGVVTVTLSDVSLADAPAVVIATEVIPNVSAPPIKFSLPYEPAKIIPNHTYAVSARIEVEGKLRFITDTRHAVITNGAPTTVDMIAVAVP